MNKVPSKDWITGFNPVNIEFKIQTIRLQGMVLSEQCENVPVSFGIFILEWQTIDNQIRAAHRVSIIFNNGTSVYR